jgi:hypothetical protein
MDRRQVSRPQRVLLVDDLADLREMWRLWLTCWGFAVEEARNGAEAVEKARARPPDLILMDLALPVLDGRAALQLLASDPVTAPIPVWPRAPRRWRFLTTGPELMSFSQNPPNQIASWSTFGQPSAMAGATPLDAENSAPWA